MLGSGTGSETRTADPEDTAVFLQRLNDTFDVLNSSTLKAANPMKEAISGRNIEDRRRFLQDTSAWLGRWNVQVKTDVRRDVRLRIVNNIYSQHTSSNS